jgi:hypothetical protein
VSVKRRAADVVDLPVVREALATVAAAMSGKATLADRTKRFLQGDLKATEDAAAMPTTKTSNTQQVTVRVEHGTIERVEALGAAFSAQPAMRAAGVTVTRADILKQALVIGVQQMERDLADTKPSKPSKRLR